MTIFSELLASPKQKSLLYVGVITNIKILMLLCQFSPSWWHHQHKNHYSMLVLSQTKKYLYYYDNFLRVAGITKTKSLLYVGVITNKKTLMLLSQFSPSCWHHQNKNHLGNYLQQATLILFLLPQNTCIMFQRS
jgi:hypothetical protein